MKRGRSLVVPAILLVVLAALALGQRAVERAAAAQNRGAREAPRFEVDPRWPDIPDTVTMGEVTSVAVDRNDHVWILHRPETAPAVLEFDGSGRYLGGWGGPSDAYEWPAVAHGISVDYKNNVWIGGRSPTRRPTTCCSSSPPPESCCCRSAGAAPAAATPTP